MQENSSQPAIMMRQGDSGLEIYRAGIRAFLEKELAGLDPAIRAGSWMNHDQAFSQKMGAKGLIGISWPERYGGSNLTNRHRFVMTEELLAAGAPAAYHWIADRQIGPLLLRYGTEVQRRHFLPAIARGEIAFCIGMSEPDTGSDLASVQTRADRIDGGYRVTGTKVWVSGAHYADYSIVLCRTDREGVSRHAGLSQLLVPLSSPGVTITPIRFPNGDVHFNEIHFDAVEVADDALVGQEGNGWAQVTSELAFERSGPERYMSNVPLLTEALRRSSPENADHKRISGKLTAQLIILRHLSQAIATRIDMGEEPMVDAAVVKDLGANFEQSIPQLVRVLQDVEPTWDGGSNLSHMLAVSQLFNPTISLRGGSREILRGIIAKGLRVR